jgi:hypothetical protein
VDVDESFAEYVSARWSMLYRLAVLLVGDEPADRVTRAALVRAYGSWHDVQEAPSADEYVKEILARTAVAEPSGEGGTTRGDPWSRLGALPRRQRVSLVLRVFEYRSDPEIGRILGRRIEEVEADASAALVSVGVSAVELGDELVHRAEEVVIPSPVLDELLARGRDERRRRTRRALGRSAAVVAVVVAALTVAGVVHALTPDRRDTKPVTAPPVPRSLAMLHDGKPPDAAYVERRTLHVEGGLSVELPDRPAAVVEAGAWVYVAYPTGPIVRVDRTTLQTETVTQGSAGQVVADRAGNYVAWLEAGPGAATVVVRGVDGALEASGHTLRFPVTPGCCENPFAVDGLTPAGDLFASLPAENRTWVWKAADGITAWSSRHHLHEISGLGNGVVSQVTPGEIVVRYLPSYFAVGVVEDSIFLAKDEINAREADFGDPRGDRVVYLDDAGEVHVSERASRIDAGTPRDVRLHLPTIEAGFSRVHWEDADHVLLDVADDSVPHGVLARCDVDSGACEIAARFDAGHLLAR